MSEKIEIDLDVSVQTIEHKGNTYKITVKNIKDDFCICGCGKKAKNRSKYYNDACRKRVSRRKILQRENSN